jgi:hypothetical protein
MRVAPEISNDAVLGMNGDPIAVSVFERRGDDRSHRDVFEFSDSPKNVSDLTRFDFELMRVIDVLISAAATFPEVRTMRLDSMRRTSFKIDNLRFGKLLFLANDFCRNQFTLDREWNENGLPVFARDAFPAESDVLDF